VTAGIEALLQLGLRGEDDDIVDSSLQLPSKRRKLNPTISPESTSLSAAPMLQQSLYSTQLSDPNIDPYLRQGSFDHDDPPSTALEPDSDLSNHHQQLTQFTTTADLLSIKSVPILKKLFAITRICPPISTPSVPPFNTPAVTRMPIISIEGDDVDIVASLSHSLSAELEKTSPVYLIDEPDDLAVFSEAFLEGLLSTAQTEKDKETDDADAARYLQHVASWRSKAAEIRRIVTDPHSQQLVLINRYILSRADAAALRLSPDVLSPLEHWQWCATLWRSCVGPDLTIYVQTLQEEVEEVVLAEEDTVEAKEGARVVFVRKAPGGRGDWGEKLLRRLEFEVREIVRSLKGFPT
jgi:HMG box factor